MKEALTNLKAAGERLRPALARARDSARTFPFRARLAGASRALGAFLTSWGPELLTITGVVLSLIWLFEFILPRYNQFVQNEYVGGLDRLRLELDFHKAIVSAIAGAGASVAVYFTWRRIKATDRQNWLAEQGQITERFTRAIDQLGATRESKDKDGNLHRESNIEVRLGAIYALERIARDSKDDH